MSSDDILIRDVVQWCFTIGLINRLRVAQRAMERAMLGVSLRDRIRNEEIRVACRRTHAARPFRPPAKWRCQYGRRADAGCFVVLLPTDMTTPSLASPLRNRRPDRFTRTATQPQIRTARATKRALSVGGGAGDVAALTFPAPRNVNNRVTQPLAARRSHKHPVSTTPRKPTPAPGAPECSTTAVAMTRSLYPCCEYNRSNVGLISVQINGSINEKRRRTFISFNIDDVRYPAAIAHTARPTPATRDTHATAASASDGLELAECSTDSRCVCGARARAGEAGARRDSRAMLTVVFAVWAAARALGWPCETPAATPEADEAPVLPRLRSARASSDLSTLSTTTTSSSQTSTSDHSKRSTSPCDWDHNHIYLTHT
ncbi:hypothetical protein MSG28_007350 [Choristoneura fumiferana]|uniref:Uncharacterized protein n=1 Tax=Choristoneura fumiferana TaxID=7141 RepID=A0ACC0JWW3_CHOFU|nr:hypothetical protein MSG28_007350 [Choristoneura fumiferana]